MLQHYTWEPMCRWLSLDVVSLYTSIPHKVGLQAIKYYLSEDPLLNPRQTEFLLDILEYCLTHNYFESNGQFYIQTQGTALGANFGPSYANLTMGQWENTYILHNNPYASQLVYYGRYIDDVVIIWYGPDKLIPAFLQHCNNNNMGPSFTSVTDSIKLSFLDLELFHQNKTICAQN